LQFLENFVKIITSENIGGLVLKNISTLPPVREEEEKQFLSKLTTLKLVNCSLNLKDIYEILVETKSLKNIGLVNCRDTFLSVIPGRRKTNHLSIAD
jgi:hypothetical protein